MLVGVVSAFLATRKYRFHRKNSVSREVVLNCRRSGPLQQNYKLTARDIRIKKNLINRYEAL